MLNFRKIIKYKHSTLSNTLKFWDSNIFDFPKELLPWKVLAIRQLQCQPLFAVMEPSENLRTTRHIIIIYPDTTSSHCHICCLKVLSSPSKVVFATPQPLLLINLLYDTCQKLPSSYIRKYVAKCLITYQWPMSNHFL